MKVILITLSVPDEDNFDYIERTWWRSFWLHWAYLMKVILITLSVPDEGNFDYIERTWWRLSQ